MGVFFCAGSRTRPIITRIDVPARLLPDASRRRLTFKTAEAASRAAGALSGRGTEALLLRTGGRDNGVFVVDFHDGLNAWDPDGSGASSSALSFAGSPRTPGAYFSPRGSAVMASASASSANASSARASNVRWVGTRMEPEPARSQRPHPTPHPLLRILRDAVSGAPTGATLLEMEGDTMQPTIPPGTVLRGVRLPPHAPPQPGRVYALQAPWGHVTVKRVQFAPSPDTLRLGVDNPSYPPLEVSRADFAQDWTIIAVLVAPDAPDAP